MGRGGCERAQNYLGWLVCRHHDGVGAGVLCFVEMVALPPRVRPAIVYTIYTIHLPTFPIREMTNCVIASVAQLRRSGLIWSAAVAGEGGRGGGGRGEWSFVEELAYRCPPSIVLFVEGDTYESLSCS